MTVRKGNIYSKESMVNYRGTQTNMTKDIFKSNTNEEKDGVEKFKSKMSLKFKTKKI